MLPLPNFISSANNKQLNAAGNNSGVSNSVKTQIDNSRTGSSSNRPQKSWNGWCSQPNLSYKNDYNTPYPIKPQEKLLSCDACCQTFFGEEKLRQHFTEHIKCGMEGCLFEAHYSIVFKHQNSEHFNLKSIAAKIVKLETPEDIEKWREARRKNFPTLTRISERQALKTQINQNRKNNQGRNIRKAFKRPHPYHDESVASSSSQSKNVLPQEGKVCHTKENLAEKEEGELTDDESDIKTTLDPKKPEAGIKLAGLCDYPSSDDDHKHEQKQIVKSKEKSQSPGQKCSPQSTEQPPNTKAMKTSKRSKKDKFIKGKSTRPSKARPLSLFEKLLLNDVRREESQIVACLEIMKRVDFKL